MKVVDRTNREAELARLDERLCAAAIEQDLGICKALLDQGANPNTRTKDGWTPLMVAAFFGNEKLARLFCDRGGDIESTSPDGSTALIWAVAGRSQEVACYLIERGANVNASNDSGFTPLVVAAEDGLSKIVKMLLEKNAHLETEEKINPVSAARSKGHDGIVSIIEEFLLTRSLTGKVVVENGRPKRMRI